MPVDSKRIEFENFETSIIDKDENKITIQIPVNSDRYHYLIDHVFRNIPMLPGVFFIELALNGYYQLYGKYPEIIYNLKFRQPVILEKDKILIDIRVVENSPNHFKIFFSDNQTVTTANAELELNFEIEDNKPADHRKFNLPGFIQNADTLDPENFYSELNKTGNQYGPFFRNLKSIWKNGNQALAQMTNISSLPGNKNHILHPALLDSAVHLISALTRTNGESFILDSIKEIKIFNKDPEDAVWCIAELDPVQSESDGFEGNVDIINPSGDIYIKFSGVRFKYPEQLTQSKSRKKLVLAGSFTIDPLMDSLKFWNHYFDYPFDIEFAPYSQIFQQLLAPSGLLQQNKDGINIILLNPEDWINSKSERITPVLSEEESSLLLKDKPVYLLPNRTKIVHLNKYETDYVYNEIFNDKVYMREGITINDGDTIIDIGANIGLFTLFVNQQCKEPHVFSFEPSPEVFELLKINCRLYGRYTKVYNQGVSDSRKRETFTYYPDSTVFSGFAADETEDRESLGQVIKNIIGNKIQADSLNLKKYADDISRERLKSKFHECEVISVSDIIEENRIQRVDLLKIDAEKSELEILNGIKPEDWPKIKQVVLEVHDKKGSQLEAAKSILKERGFLVSVKEENYLQRSGLFNVYAVRERDTASAHTDAEYRQTLEQNIKLFSDTVASFAKGSKTPLIIGITPPSYESSSDNGLRNLLIDAGRNLAEYLSAYSNIHIIKSDEFLKPYRLKDYYDKYSNELGHIPYNNDFFASMGSTIIRKVISLIISDYKVIVLDCDNTLWKGICGEDGYKGVKITRNYKQLQNFMIDQMNSGKLICLCSKNNEKDVWNIFERRNDMILKREHIVSSRINWDSKSKNLESLSSELNLGLDSFVFIDDNPLECEEVRKMCPSVLTLQLPENENSIPSFLSSVWVFDKSGNTEEDKKRTVMYKENIARNLYAEKSHSLRDFINGLGLNISIYEPGRKHLSRISQLTFRTNQFNFTSIRRNEPEITSLLNNENIKCMITEVSDRFGNYGMVGVLIYEFHNNKIIIDTFLLSCRVLGKGVEYKILSELGKTAANIGIKEIGIRFVPNNKNQPASDFIHSLKSLHTIEQDGELMFWFLPEYLSDLKYDPDDQIPTSLNQNNQKKFNHSMAGDFSPVHFQKIAGELYNINLLQAEIERSSLNDIKEKRKDLIAPCNNLERRLCAIWTKVLGKKEISTNDNFFESGGTSLKAIQIIAAINKELKADLSITSLFEYSTVNSLAQHISAVPSSPESNQAEEIKERGARRRNISYKRKRT